jgi:hypothetical protein
MPYTKNYPLRKLIDEINAIPTEGSAEIDLGGNVYYLNEFAATGDDGILYDAMDSIVDDPDDYANKLVVRNKYLTIKNGTIILFQDSEITNEGDGLFSIPFYPEYRKLPLIHDPDANNYSKTPVLAKYPPQPDGVLTTYTIDRGSWNLSGNGVVNFTSENGTNTFDNFFIDGISGASLIAELQNVLDEIILDDDGISTRQEALEGCGIIVRSSPGNIVDIGYIGNYQESSSGVTIGFVPPLSVQNRTYFTQFNIYGRKTFLNYGNFSSDTYDRFCPDFINKKIFYKPISGSCNQLFRSPDSLVSSSGVTFSGYNTGFLSYTHSQSYDPITNTFPYGITLENLTFVGSYSKESTSLSYSEILSEVYSPTNTTVKGCTFYRQLNGMNIPPGNAKIENNNFLFTLYSGLGLDCLGNKLIKNNRLTGCEKSSALKLFNTFTTENTGTVTVTGNYFSLPAANHGQAISAYANTWNRFDINGNIFHNCQRALSLQSGNHGVHRYLLDLAVNDMGGGYTLTNNLFLVDELPPDFISGQPGFSYNGTSPQDSIQIEIQDPENLYNISSNSLTHFILQRKNSVTQEIEDYNLYDDFQTDGLGIGTEDCPILLQLPNKTVTTDRLPVIDGDKKRFWCNLPVYSTYFFGKLLQDDLYVRFVCPSNPELEFAGVTLERVLWQKPSPPIRMENNTWLFGITLASILDSGGNLYGAGTGLGIQLLSRDDYIDIDCDGQKEQITALRAPSSNGAFYAKNNIIYSISNVGFSGGTESNPSTEILARRLYGEVLVENNILTSKEPHKIESYYLQTTDLNNEDLKEGSSDYSYVEGIKTIYPNFENGSLSYPGKGILWTTNGLPTGKPIYPNINDIINIPTNWAETYIPVNLFEQEPESFGFTLDLVYGITHTNYNDELQYDEYVWTIISSNPIVSGTFLDGTPWVVDNGSLHLYSVTPTEQGITTEEGTGLVNRTVINPDFGKLIRDPAISGISFSDSTSFVRCTNEEDFTQKILNPFDFRAGVFVNSDPSVAGTGYDPTQAVDLSSPILLSVGDMVVTQTAFTEGLGGESYNLPFTESYGCFSVVDFEPPANAFRPPINWDPTDKVNRPIFTEGNTFSDNIITYPNYYLSSDDASSGFSRSTIAYSSSLENRLGTICPAYYAKDPSGLRGTLKSHDQVGDEYGGVQAKSEESMMISAFDSGVDPDVRDKFRRTLAQRGIDTFGAMYSLGKNVNPNGYHNGEYQPRVYFAWAVCGDSRMFDVLDYKIGNRENSTYKEFSEIDIYGGSNCYHETGQCFVTTNVCSFRHFDIPIVEYDDIDNKWIKVSRPLRMNQLTESDVNSAPIHLAGSGTSFSPWGWGNNSGVPNKEIIGAYIRLKSFITNDPPIITRIIDAEPVIGLGSEQDPQYFKLYVQENVINGLETNCDLSSSLVETRNIKGLIRNITYEYANTSSETSTIPYDFSVISHALSNHLISKTKGGRDFIPGWGRAQWDKSIRLLTTDEGKYLLLKGNNTSYNISDTRSSTTPSYKTSEDLYFAVCRQEIADGISLAPSPVEEGRDYTDAANWYGFPETRTWEELSYPTGDIVYYSKGLSTVNNPSPLYYYSNNNEFIPTKRFNHTTKPDGNKQIKLDCTSPGSGTAWGNLSSMKTYVWPSGMTSPIELTFDSPDYTTASDETDSTWITQWIFDNNFRSVVPQSVNPSYSATSVFFVNQNLEIDNSIVFDSEVSGTIYMSVWDGSGWELYKSDSLTGLTKEFFHYRGLCGGAASENEIFVISRQDPGDPSMWSDYREEFKHKTFSDLKALISKSTDILDLNGEIFEAESTDLDITLTTSYGAPRLDTTIHTIKNGTIIAGRKGLWTEIGDGIYKAPLTDDEFAILSVDPRAHLYDANATEIPSMATYPAPPDAMLPRNAMSYNSNWWYMTKQNEEPKGRVYTHGRILTIVPFSGDFPEEGSEELNNLFDLRNGNRPIVYTDGTNEGNALSKGQVRKWSPSTKQIHLRELQYRTSTEDGFILDKRAWDTHPLYDSFNVGDTITERDSGNQYIITESTNTDALYAEIYGFNITDRDLLQEITVYISDMNLQFFVFFRSSSNVVFPIIPHSFNPTTGDLLFKNEDNPSYSGSYSEFALSGNEKIVRSFPYSSYSIDYATKSYLYKPANGDPSGAYLPTMPRALYIVTQNNGITLENMTIIGGCNAGSTPAVIRQTDNGGQINILDCLFKQTPYAVRLVSNQISVVRGNVFRDTYERCFSGLSDGSIVENNVFDNTETRSVLFLGAEPRGAGSENTPVRKTIIRDNAFYLPASNHGQGVSLYVNSWHNALIEHNIFYNCQRAFSFQGEDLPFRTTGGTCEIQNNLFINDAFVDTLPGGQKTIAFNGKSDLHIPEGDQKVYVRSNTVYTQEDLFTGDPFSTWKMSLQNLLSSKVFVENNFCGGIDASLEELEVSSFPHQHRNNFAQGASNYYGSSFSETDLYYPSGVTLSDLFDFDRCSMTGDLLTAASDGGTLGIRWSVIPTRNEINNIFIEGDVNWANRYPAQSIPKTPESDENWSLAYFNQDRRLPSFSQPAPETEYSVTVDIIDDTTYRFRLNDDTIPSIKMIRGVTYTFDQSLSSNMYNHIAISAIEDGSHNGGAGYTYGFSYTGIPGIDGIATFIPPMNAPSILYYYSESEPGMGGIIGIADS